MTKSVLGDVIGALVSRFCWSFFAFAFCSFLIILMSSSVHFVIGVVCFLAVVGDGYRLIVGVVDAVF